MTVREREREIIRETEPEKKVEPPKRYQVVYSQKFTFVCGCNIGLLSEVFNLSSSQARRHIVNAIHNGKETVFEGSRDVVDTKIDQATSKAHGPDSCRMLSEVIFTREPD